MQNNLDRTSEDNGKNQRCRNIVGECDTSNIENLADFNKQLRIKDIDCIMILREIAV